MKPSRVAPIPTVLLVEASLDNSAIYAAYLRRHGLTVLELSTTDDALASVGAADLFVINLTAPGALTGTEFIQHVRRTPAIQRKPLIALSSAALREDREAAVNAGCDDFFTKPCGPDTLLRAVRRLLRAPKT
jgi:CheY-like chemotaxis protein